MADTVTARLFMAAIDRAHIDNRGLVAAARSGDERAFIELTSSRRASCTRTATACWGRCTTPTTPFRTEDPEAAVIVREAIGLAFVAAVQLLPPRQRAILVLRDVLDCSASEVADLLDDSVPAVDSALQRARTRLARERDEGSLARAHRPTDAGTEAAVMRGFQDAWEAVDIAGIIALLADDALMTMPPESVRVAGAAQIGAFFATVPMDGRLERIRLRAGRANGQPALAAYAEGEAGAYGAYGLMVLR